MARTNTLGNFLTDVANAIRTAEGSSDVILASDFDTRIEALSGGGGLDWSVIGYDSIPQSIINDYNYSKNIYDNWDATQQDLSSKFQSNNNLVYMPLVDTSNATTVNNMFYECTNLTSIPLLNFSNVTSGNYLFYNCSKLEAIPQFNTTNFATMGDMFRLCINLKTVPVLNTSNLTNANSMRRMFTNCTSLSDESLNNILAMCINATSYVGTKTLAQLGITATTLIDKVPTLSNYQAFINAGWTIQ